MTVGRLPSIEGGIQPTIVDAKGDLITAVAADTPARLAVGANDTVLTADSTTATGLKWATPAAGGMTLLASGTLSGTSVTLSSISQDYKSLQLRLIDFNLPSSSTIDLEYNGDTSSTYIRHGYYGDVASSPTFAGTSEVGYQRLFWFGPSAGDNNNYAQIDLFNYTTSTLKLSEVRNQYLSGNRYYDLAQAVFPSTSAITQIKIKNLSGSFAGGTYELLGIK